MTDTPTPKPLTTEAQIELLTQTAENAVRRFERRRTRSSRIGYGVLTAGIILALFTSQHDAASNRDAIVQSGKVVAVDGCNRDFTTIGILRDQIVKGKGQTRLLYKEGTITKVQLDRAIKDTDAFLKKYPQPDCRKAEAILTSNANAVRTVPEPLYAHPPAPNPPHVPPVHDGPPF